MNDECLGVIKGQKEDKNLPVEYFDLSWKIEAQLTGEAVIEIYDRIKDAK